jgi:hypothetical protein
MYVVAFDKKKKKEKKKAPKLSHSPLIPEGGDGRFET